MFGHSNMVGHIHYAHVVQICKNVQCITSNTDSSTYALMSRPSHDYTQRQGSTRSPSPKLKEVLNESQICSQPKRYVVRHLRQGDLCSDCCISTFCPYCAAIQITRELQHRGL
ncbi:unnamed protein product [Didymodactylos carnosus]|uniref:Uncharacterized protein n=1 Tax=Didymodactylos carnosus TaxID=1234261 RepID=A0A8S2E1A1_9BILA|nr:unnamed protein product [Didymodactylos carnosus]CAF3807323.1 unnamed protein product [Didymodactylos carnosus]